MSCSRDVNSASVAPYVKLGSYTSANQSGRGLENLRDKILSDAIDVLYR